MACKKKLKLPILEDDAFKEKPGKNFGAEKEYINAMFEDMDKIGKFYTQALAVLVDSQLDLAKTVYGLQKECAEHNKNSASCDIEKAKELPKCKSLPDTISLQSDLIRQQLDHALQHMSSLSNFMRAMSDNLARSIEHGVGFVNNQVQNSCGIYRTKNR